MTSTLNPQTVQRLAFIRFLYEQGLAQTRQPQPMAATSVLSFHDAIELFLVLAGEHLQVNLPTQISFSQYWDKLADGLPPSTQLPSKKAMERMNKLRVNLKHHGATPSPTDIEQVRADITTFFTDATPLVFGGDFAQIDMVDLVTRRRTVAFLDYAGTCVDSGDLPAAMAALLVAFTEMIDHYTEAREYRRGQPFRFGDNIREFNAFFNRPPDVSSRSDPAIGRLSRVLKKITEHLEKLTRSTSDIQQALRVTGLGIDYARYAQFRVLTPTIRQHGNGRTTFHVDEAHKSLTVDDYRFGRLFVIESALQAARADAVLERSNAHQAANNPEPGVWHTGAPRAWEGPPLREVE